MRTQKLFCFDGIDGLESGLIPNIVCVFSMFVLPHLNEILAIFPVVLHFCRVLHIVGAFRCKVLSSSAQGNLISEREKNYERSMKLSPFSLSQPNFPTHPH